MADTVKLKKQRKPDFYYNGIGYYFSEINGFPAGNGYKAYYIVRNHATDDEEDLDNLDLMVVNEVFDKIYDVIIDPFYGIIEVDYFKNVNYLLSDDEVKQNLKERHKRLERLRKKASGIEKKKLSEDLEHLRWTYYLRFRDLEFISW